jgi:DNA-binding response OmpR family regulator
MHEVLAATQPDPNTTIRASTGVFAIVEDDPHMSAALGMWLSQLGTASAHYTAGESLLEALHYGNECLSLQVDGGKPSGSRLLGAVLDLNLTGMTGMELARQLRHLDPRLPIAIITALSEAERRRHGEPPQGIRCLQKPFDLDDLENALSPAGVAI